MGIKVGYFVLIKKDWVSSHRQKSVAMFGPNCVNPFKLIDVVSNKLGTYTEGEITTVKFDQIIV